MLLCCFATMKSCVYLSDSWLMIESKWPRFKENRIQDPYPMIGKLSVGSWMRTLCSVSMDIQLFGAALVFLLFSATFAFELIKNYQDQLKLCDFIIIIGLFLCPFTWLGSPQDFKPIAFGAMFSTLISCVLLMVIIFSGEPAISISEVEYSKITVTSFLRGLNTMLFGFGGAVTLPTFQNDMKTREKFPIAIVVGFLSKSLSFSYLLLLSQSLS